VVATAASNANPDAMNTRCRFLLVAAALPVKEARAILPLVIAIKAKDSAPFERTRSRVQRNFKSTLVRVLKFAKHEILRKLHRYMYQNQPLHGQDEPADHPDASKVAFNVDELRHDLDQMLQTQLPGALQSVADDTLASVGYNDPWKFPAQEALDLIYQRKNLISGVPDEIFAEIQNEIATGLSQGESIDDLAKRISGKFDEIIKSRAELIAQTETAAAYGFASQAAALQAGVPYKQWIHSGLPLHPRPDHLEIDGLIVPIEEPYPVGDPPLMYPHDPDGSAEDVINCGCISIPATEEDYAKQEGAPVEPAVAPVAEVAAPVAEVAALPMEELAAEIKSALSQDVIEVGPPKEGGTSEVRFITFADGSRGVFKPRDPLDGVGGEAKARANGEVLGRPISGNLYLREAAASDISDIIDLPGDLVPETIVRDVGGRIGAVQDFVENAVEGADSPTEFGTSPEKLRLAAAFDYLIGNTDRHGLNWMVTDGGDIKLIDNGLTLPRNDDHFYSKLFDDVAHRGVAIPSEVVDWQSHWPEIKTYLQSKGFSADEINGMENRLIELVDQETFNDLRNVGI
jgi:hypothetical protein